MRERDLANINVCYCCCCCFYCREIAHNIIRMRDAVSSACSLAHIKTSRASVLLVSAKLKSSSGRRHWTA